MECSIQTEFGWRPARIPREGRGRTKLGITLGSNHGKIQCSAAACNILKTLRSSFANNIAWKSSPCYMKILTNEKLSLVSQLSLNSWDVVKSSQMSVSKYIGSSCIKQLKNITKHNSSPSHRSSRCHLDWCSCPPGPWLRTHSPVWANQSESHHLTARAMKAMASEGPWDAAEGHCSATSRPELAQTAPWSSKCRAMDSPFTSSNTIQHHPTTVNWSALNWGPFSFMLGKRGRHWLKKFCKWPSFPAESVTSACSCHIT